MRVALHGGMIRSDLRLSARLAALALAGTFTASAAACGRDAEPPAAEQPVEAAAAELGTDTAAIFIAPEETSDERPATIYYDLTRHHWYARGEPLLHEGRRYQPAGSLVTAAGGAMERLGEYGGVDYYRQIGAGLETLYVPVHDRYWLGFRLQDAVPPGG